MCMTCGGRCLLCGELSVYVIISPPIIGVVIELFSCEEHHEEVSAKVEQEMQLRAATPWN